MSKMSTVLDKIRTILPTLLSGKTELTNPYEVEKNNVNLRRNGYGVTLGEANNLTNQEYHTFFEERDFNIVLVREVLRTEHDPDAIHTVSKSIMDDSLTLKRDFLQTDLLEIPNSICKVSYTNMSGIEFVEGNNFSFAKMDITFSIQVNEVL